jgi:hypothetical protein
MGYRIPVKGVRTEPVRDLLGIVRALWRAGFEGNASPERLRELEEIGRMLRIALKYSRLDPDTIGGRAAVKWAEQATERLGRLIQDEEKLGPVVTATARKLTG